MAAPVRFPLLGAYVLGPLLALFWPKLFGRGFLAVTREWLWYIDLKEEELTDWPLSELREVRFRKRPFVDDLLTWDSEEVGEVEIHLAGDWSYFQQVLQKLLSSRADDEDAKDSEVNSTETPNAGENNA